MPQHTGVELHGFLNYLVKVALQGETYTIFGYKGKQVRDQIHSYDVVQAFEAFAQNPRPGEVYNLGGGRENSACLLECLELLEALAGRRVPTAYVERAAQRRPHLLHLRPAQVSWAFPHVAHNEAAGHDHR